MLGLFLARAGVDVAVLEKHDDFLRDFRGDTIHPSTLELMRELGMLDDFLCKAHQEVTHIGIQIGDDFWFANYLQVCRVDATMGLPRFPCGEGPRVFQFSPPHGDQSDRTRQGGAKWVLSNHPFGFDIKQRDLFEVELDGDLFTQMK